MKFTDLMQKGVGELYEICAELKKSHMNMRISVKSGQEVKTSAMRGCRKDIARVMTRLSQLKKQEVR
jgi:ribosomal protein L29